MKKVCDMCGADKKLQEKINPQTGKFAVWRCKKCDELAGARNKTIRRLFKESYG